MIFAVQKREKEEEMSRLWMPCFIGRLELPTRLVVTAAGEGMCDDRFHATSRLVERYRELGKEGAAGLVITGHAFVCPEGRRREGQISAADDAVIEPLRAVTAAARADGSRIFLQLSHGGLCCDESLTGIPAAGPSAADRAPYYAGRAMTAEETRALPGLFAAAARRAKLAGFDGVELHMAHGFLLSEFLSPFFNHREDEYGGSQENRTRLAVEIIRAVHAECGGDFPVMAKINAEDGVEGGMTIDMSLESAGLMQEAGLDGLEVSGGFCFWKKQSDTPMKPVSLKTGKGVGYFLEAARRFHEALSIPVIAVGGIRTFETAEAVLADGDADMAGLCRPLIRDPALARRWRRGETVASDCLSCNRCVALSRTSAGLGCPVRKEAD